MLVHNPTEVPVKGFNKDGSLYTILPNETIEMPDLHGTHILQTFGFLKGVKEPVGQLVEREPEKAVPFEQEPPKDKDEEMGKVDAILEAGDVVDSQIKTYEEELLKDEAEKPDDGQEDNTDELTARALEGGQGGDQVKDLPSKRPKWARGL